MQRIEKGWINTPSVTYVTSSSDSSDSSDQSDSETTSPLLRRDYSQLAQPMGTQETIPTLEHLQHLIQQLRKTIQDKDGTIMQMVKELDRKNKSINYYESEVKYLHSKLCVLEGGSPRQKRSSFRSSYACGVCKRRPKSTACICNNKKRKRVPSQ
jgi:septal ring factor EnvC (AmiA/AmiB activator)